MSLILVYSSVYCQMVHISGGTHLLGSNNGKRDERPEKSIQISSFSINKFEVSLEQYDSCVQAGKCTKAHYNDGKCYIWTSKGPKQVTVPMRYQNPKLPVVCVTWFQSHEYCKSKGMRLPTEAEWEYAAGTTLYAWGRVMPSSKCCVYKNRHAPEKVGSFAPNSRNIYDMTGNVWEWTNDRYDAEFYLYARNKDPIGPPVGRYRSIRGGGWYSTARQLRIKNRQWFVPEKGEVSIGFRCVK